MKRVISLCLAITIFTALFCGFTALADEAPTGELLLQIGNQYMYILGEPVLLDAAPILHNDRTMLPIRAVVEALGGTVSWDGANQQITINVSGTQILMWLGNTSVSVNGQYQSMDVAPFTMNDRTLVPVRFVSDNIPGCQTSWNQDTQSVSILFGGSVAGAEKTGYWKFTRVIENPNLAKDYYDTRSEDRTVIEKNDTNGNVESYTNTFTRSDVHVCQASGCHDGRCGGEFISVSMSYSRPKESYAPEETVYIDLSAAVTGLSDYYCLNSGNCIKAGMSIVNPDNIYYSSWTLKDENGESWIWGKLDDGGVHGNRQRISNSATVSEKMYGKANAGDKVYIIIDVAPTSTAKVQLAYEYVWTVQ